MRRSDLLLMVQGAQSRGYSQAYCSTAVSGNVTVSGCGVGIGRLHRNFDRLGQCPGASSPRGGFTDYWASAFADSDADDSLDNTAVYLADLVSDEEYPASRRKPRDTRGDQRVA